MLDPIEYARAQGFAPGYRFYASAKRRKYKPEQRCEYIMEGPRDKIVKQIGNAVEWHVAHALCKTAIQLAKPRNNS
jgi:site-specific DNA-cytosine methylase